LENGRFSFSNRNTIGKRAERKETRVFHQPLYYHLRKTEEKKRPEERKNTSELQRKTIKESSSAEIRLKEERGIKKTQPTTHRRCEKSYVWLVAIEQRRKGKQRKPEKRGGKKDTHK